MSEMPDLAEKLLLQQTQTELADQVSVLYVLTKLTYKVTISETMSFPDSINA